MRVKRGTPPPFAKIQALPVCTAALLLLALALTGCPDSGDTEEEEELTYTTYTFHGGGGGGGGGSSGPFVHVRFVKNDGNMPVEIAIRSVPLGLPVPPSRFPTFTRSGYTFTGWNTAADGSGSLFDDTITVTADIDVYAQWNPAGGSGGSFSGPVAVLYDDSTTLTGAMSQGRLVISGTPSAAARYIVSITPDGASPILIGRAKNDVISLNIDASGTLAFRSGSPVPIGSYAEFQLINATNAARSNRYKQEADLDLLGDAALGGLRQEWTRVGDDTSPFTGTYDGNSKGIAHLYINKTGTSFNNDSFQGLFGYLDGGCVVKNVFLRSGNVRGYEAVGAIAGYNNGGAIADCTNAALVTAGIGGAAGGIAGVNNDGGSITGCRNTGNVVSSGRAAGGITGDNCDAAIIDCHNTGAVSSTFEGVGGLTGYSYVFNGSAATIAACSNGGAVSGGNGSIGGLVGNNGANAAITACYNTGVVSGTGPGNGFGGLAGGNAAGGTITACYNTGAVLGTADDHGGLVGDNTTGGAITACYNTGAVSGSGNNNGGLVGNHTTAGSTIIACYNIGSVTGGVRGGLVGNFANGTIDNCYWEANTGPSDYYGSIGLGTAAWNLPAYTARDGAFFGPALDPPPNTAPANGGHAQWGTGGGHAANQYWRTGYTGRNVGGTMYPALGWE